MKKSLSYLLALCIIALAVIYGCQKNTNTNPAFGRTDEEAGRLHTNAAALETATPNQIHGLWHAGNDACTCAAVLTVTDCDSKDQWLIDRGNGQPSVNMV